MVNKTKSTACVTGASGLICRRIVPRLLGLGYEVRVLSRRQDFKILGAESYYGGLEDEAVLENFLQNAHIMFHCAAELTDQSRMWDVNVAGTERLLRLAAAAGIEYLCHLSSADVVGITDRVWVDETCPCHPQNEYEWSKWEAERIAAHSRIPRIVILRPTMAIDATRPGVLDLALRGSMTDRLKLFIKGGECAHQVHAEDVAAAALFFLDRPVISPQCYFVSLDHDPLNTVGGYWRLCQAYRRQRPVKQVKPALHLPLLVPHLLRRIWRGRGNRGDVHFSSQRLMDAGFAFPLGVQGAVWQIMSERSAGS